MNHDDKPQRLHAVLGVISCVLAPTNGVVINKLQSNVIDSCRDVMVVSKMIVVGFIVVRACEVYGTHCTFYKHCELTVTCVEYAPSNYLL